MEEGGDDVKSARPLRPGLHTCYNGRYSELVSGDSHLILKAVPSSDRGLQPDPVKLDSLVIAHQPWRGEYVPGPCTHRPSSHESRDRKVRLEHLLSGDGVCFMVCIFIYCMVLSIPLLFLSIGYY